MPCEEELPINCDTCLEVTFTDCTAITVTTTNLVAGANYHLYVIDKFNKLRNTTVTIAVDKSFTIDTTQFPSGLFNSYAGKFEIFLSTTDTGDDYDVNLTISGTTYNCIIASFNIAASETCCDSDPVCKTVCEQIEEVSAQVIADCLEDASGTKLADVKALICESEGSDVFKSNGTTLVTHLDDGGSYSIPKHNILNSAGVLVIAEEFDVNYTTPNVKIYDSTGTVLKYTKEAGVNQSIPTHQVINHDLTVNATAQFDENTTLLPVTFVSSEGVTSYLKPGETGTCTPASPLTYAFPSSSGQLTSFATGDAATIQSTIFNNLPSGRIITLLDFFTLSANNSFGNTNRFTDTLGGQTYANSVLVDNYTGLAWFKTLQVSNSWLGAIAAAIASTAAGLSGWHVPSFKQYMSVAWYGQSAGASHVLSFTQFGISSGFAGQLWLSNTLLSATAFKYFSGAEGGFSYANSGSRQYVICKKFF